MTGSKQGPPAAPRRRPWLRAVAAAVAVALFVGWFSGTAMRLDARIRTPPGFARGLLHGALMPLAWPGLLTGRDQEIYAQANLGRTYKLGYSLGVNVCGAVFFGWFFGRVRRLKSLRERGSPAIITSRPD